MKKQLLKFLLGIVYIGIIVALLMAHIQLISGQMQRIMAMIETLLLVIPAVIVLYLYVKVKESESKGNGKDRQSEQEAEVIVSSYEQLVELVRPYELSNRELEVTWLLYKGYTNRQIAQELFVTENTIKKHASHVYEKMQVSGRKELREKVRSKR